MATTAATIATPSATTPTMMPSISGFDLRVGRLVEPPALPDPAIPGSLASRLSNPPKEGVLTGVGGGAGFGGAGRLAGCPAGMPRRRDRYSLDRHRLDRAQRAELPALLAAVRRVGSALSPWRRCRRVSVGTPRASADCREPAGPGRSRRGSGWHAPRRGRPDSRGRTWFDGSPPSRRPRGPFRPCPVRGAENAWAADELSRSPTTCGRDRKRGLCHRPLGDLRYRWEHRYFTDDAARSQIFPAGHGAKRAEARGEGDHRVTEDTEHCGAAWSGRRKSGEKVREGHRGRHVICRPGIVPAPEAKRSVSSPRRCSIETYRRHKGMFLF